MTWRDVGVEVPEHWVDGDEPGIDWCANMDEKERDLPMDPYVARNIEAGITFDIACVAPRDGRPEEFGTAPQSWWAPHLTFGEPIGRDETAQFRGWTITERTVGSVQLRLWTDVHTEDLVDRILGSAQTFTTDANGCDVTSPAQAREYVRPDPEFDVSGIEHVDAISVCQYDRHRGQEVALMASRRIEGTSAAALLRGIRDAPVGGGPDKPWQCVDYEFGDHAIVVRLHHGERTEDLYVYYDYCFHNGIDDGTTKRQLTASNCAPLFGGPLIPWRYQSYMHRLCGQAGAAS